MAIFNGNGLDFRAAIMIAVTKRCALSSVIPLVGDAFLVIFALAISVFRDNSVRNPPIETKRLETIWEETHTPLD
jgi:hypothetical protein